MSLQILSATHCNTLQLEQQHILQHTHTHTQPLTLQHTGTFTTTHAASHTGAPTATQVHTEVFMGANDLYVAESDCNTLQHTLPHIVTHTATHDNTHCNTHFCELQHTATHTATWTRRQYLWAQMTSMSLRDLTAVTPLCGVRKYMNEL